MQVFYFKQLTPKIIDEYDEWNKMWMQQLVAF